MYVAMFAFMCSPVWRYTDSTFTAATAPVGKAAFIFPTDRAIQVDPAPTFKWTTAPNAQSYYLYVGTSVGANNLVNTGEIQPTTFTAPTLPANVTLYARLWTKLGGVWRYVDISFSGRPVGVTATGCSAQPGTMIYGQNWSKGVAPQAMPNQPYYNSGSLYYQSSAWGGADPPDPVYPEIDWSESVTVVSGAGPAGENVLDFNPAGRQFGEDYGSAVLDLYGFGPIPDQWGNMWDATEGCISISSQWTTAAWDDTQSPYHYLVAQDETQDGWMLGAKLDRDDPTRGHFFLTHSTYPNEPSAWALQVEDGGSP